MTRLQNSVVNSELKLAIEREAVELFSAAPAHKAPKLPLQSLGNRNDRAAPSQPQQPKPAIDDYHPAIDTLDYDEAENELLPVCYEAEQQKKQDT